MPEFLQGNYQLSEDQKKKVQSKASEETEGLTEQFEKEALAKLGGSMCFVMKGKTFLWTGEEIEKPSP